MWACYPMGRGLHVHVYVRSLYKIYVSGTALGLLAVPTKLGNPGGWEYRRVLLYSHMGVKILLGKIVFGFNFFLF